MTTCSSTSGRPSPAPGNAFEVKASPPVQIRGRASGAASSRTCFLRMPVIVSRSWSPAGRNPRSRTSSQVGRSAVWSPRGTGRKRSAPAIPSRNRQLDRIPRRVGTVGTVAALVPGRPPGHDPAGHLPSVGDSVEVDEDLLLVSGGRLGGDERGRKFYLQQPALVRAVFDPGAQGREWPLFTQELYSSHRKARGPQRAAFSKARSTIVSAIDSAEVAAHFGTDLTTVSLPRLVMVSSLMSSPSAVIA